MFPVASGLRHLLFEHYPVDPGVVEPHVPADVTLDTFDGDAWVSVVALENVAVRPVGVPRPLGLRLPELNLRTYVTRGGDDGVYFLSVDLDGPLAVAATRWFHRLPSFRADVDLVATGDGVRFASRRRHRGARPAEYVATYGPVGEVFRPEDGSLAAFLVERYRSYVATPDGLRFTAIEHERWPLREATAEVERNTLFVANGFEHPGSEPVLHYSPGVDVRASRSRSVE